MQQLLFPLPFSLQRYCEFETQSFMGGTSAIGKNIAEYAKSKNADTIIVGNRGKHQNYKENEKDVMERSLSWAFCGC